jgi:hypothetical protein
LRIERQGQEKKEEAWLRRRGRERRAGRRDTDSDSDADADSGADVAGMSTDGSFGNDKEWMGVPDPRENAG